MLLDTVVADVTAQLETQSELGIQVTRQNEVPEVGPTNRGLWLEVPQVTAVFADLKRSTELVASSRPEVAARAYTYFVRGMAVTLERFSAGYVDIHGDGIFGLFSGSGSIFSAAACAVTMKTLVEREISDQFEGETESDWKFAAGIGIDQGTLLVRRLGLRGTKQNEVWAGKPLNMAAKLSSVAEPDQVVVSDRVYSGYENSSRLRQRALLWTCGCENGVDGQGLDTPSGQTPGLWIEEPAPEHLGFDFATLYRLSSCWCRIHGPEFCEAIVTGQRPAG